jgi:hypothetical protein
MNVNLNVLNFHFIISWKHRSMYIILPILSVSIAGLLFLTSLLWHINVYVMIHYLHKIFQNRQLESAVSQKICVDTHRGYLITNFSLVVI